MARVEPLTRSEIEKLDPETRETFAVIEKSNGYIPTSYLTLAHKPNILKAFSALSKAVIRDEGEIDRGFRFLIAHTSSKTVGCNYCQAHNYYSAERWGISAEKMEAVWTFEDSDLFTPAEKAALRVAVGASMVPNMVTDEDFAELHKYYNNAQIIEIMSVVCLFGWLHRFTDSIACELEEHSIAWAEEKGMRDHGWDPSHHQAHG